MTKLFSSEVTAPNCDALKTVAQFGALLLDPNEQFCCILLYFFVALRVQLGLESSEFRKKGLKLVWKVTI